MKTDNNAQVTDNILTEVPGPFVFIFIKYIKHLHAKHQTFNPVVRSYPLVCCDDVRLLDQLCYLMFLKLDLNVAKCFFHGTTCITN